MKIKYLTVLVAAAILGSCVSDYTDFNPPHKLDAPTIRINSASTSQVLITTPVNQFQTASQAFVSYGEPVEYTISVIDAPGKFAGVTVTPSVPEFGEVTIDEASVNALIGQETGEFKFTFTPSATLPDLSDRALNLVVDVSDSQLNQKGESDPKVTRLTLPVSLVSCVSEDIEEGTYQVTAASGNLDGNVAYTLDDLVADFGGDVFVTITSIKPGRYQFNEVTGGIWPTYYSGRANPALNVDLCGTEIVGHAGEVTAAPGTATARTFTLTGTLNNDGTIDMTWSYVRNDGATPANPAKGTYTLTPVD